MKTRSPTAAPVPTQWKQGHQQHLDLGVVVVESVVLDGVAHVKSLATEQCDGVAHVKSPATEHWWCSPCEVPSYRTLMV